MSDTEAETGRKTTMSTQRRFHTDSRARENFTEDGLKTLTGQSARNWGRYVVKELVDNALEAVERGATPDPRVQVSVDVAGRGRRRHLREVTVADNGNGIPHDRVEKIADTTAFGGTKRHYTLPTRGTQGNALMTIVGIQHLAEGGPLVIATGGRRYELRVDGNTISRTPDVTVNETAPQTEWADRGTVVRVTFGESGRDWAAWRQTAETLAGFAALNPHVELDAPVAVSGGTDDTTVSYSPKGDATSGRVLWYDQQAFDERVKADIRADPSLTVGEFIGEFDGLRSQQKRAAVLDAVTVVDIEATDRLQSALARGEELHSEATEKLRLKMCDETRAWSASNFDNTLGRVGESLADGPAGLLEQQGFGDTAEGVVADLQADGAEIDNVRDLTVYYRTCGAAGDGSDPYRQPFVFELAALPLSTDSRVPTQHQFGINQSVAYSTPKATVNFRDTAGDRRHLSIESAFNEEAHEFVVVSNLTCPNIPFEDKGKQSFPTEPFEDAISEVVGKAIRKYQRDLRPMLNSLEEDDSDDTPTLPADKKAPRGFVKDAVFELFEPVYQRATDGGEYTITMRQFFYELRPAFQRLAERRGVVYKSSATLPNPAEIELVYDTFTGYVDEYEQEVLRERVIHRDDRGFFVEPHSERRIELSTKKVDQYDPTDAVTEEYDTLLFVEKTGFYEQLHHDFEITKRFDIGLINAQGYSTTAIRRLIETVQAVDPDVRLLTLTDLDVNGVGIAEDANRADPLGKAVAFGAERLGVTPADVEEYDLGVESVSYNSEALEKLKTRYNDGEVGDATYEFLAEGNRVEINAFAPTELRDYVETRLEELGVSKLSPAADDIETPDVESWEDKRENAIDRAIGKFVLNQTDDELRQSLIDSDSRLAFPDGRTDADGVDADTVRERVAERLATNPAASWREVNEEVNEEVTEELTNEQEDYSDTVEEAVKELLDEHDVVTVSPLSGES